MIFYFIYRSSIYILFYDHFGRYVLYLLAVTRNSVSRLAILPYLPSPFRSPHEEVRDSGNFFGDWVVYRAAAKLQEVQNSQIIEKPARAG